MGTELGNGKQRHRLAIGSFQRGAVQIGVRGDMYLQDRRTGAQKAVDRRIGAAVFEFKRAQTEQPAGGLPPSPKSPVKLPTAGALERLAQEAGKAAHGVKEHMGRNAQTPAAFACYAGCAGTGGQLPPAGRFALQPAKNGAGLPGISHQDTKWKKLCHNRFAQKRMQRLQNRRRKMQFMDQSARRGSQFIGVRGAGNIGAFTHAAYAGPGPCALIRKWRKSRERRPLRPAEGSAPGAFPAARMRYHPAGQCGRRC